MELFVVKNKSGEVVRRNIKSKVEAKKQRAELHNIEGINEAEITSWKKDSKYFVSKGANHAKFKGRLPKNAYST